MSDDVLSVIPTDPHWQPDRPAADRAAALVTEMAPGLPDGADVEIDVIWHDVVTVVDAGENLEKIVCSLCGGSIDLGWWADLLEVHCESGFATLSVEVPCCRGETSLEALEYEWPCGFARFEIAIWNPERSWFDAEELALLADALGHPLRQVRAHI
jgi:hypothetical protein